MERLRGGGKRGGRGRGGRDSLCFLESFFQLLEVAEGQAASSHIQTPILFCFWGRKSQKAFQQAAPRSSPPPLSHVFLPLLQFNLCSLKNFEMFFLMCLCTWVLEAKKHKREDGKLKEEANVSK